MATMSGAFPEGFTPSLDLFLTPTFRGYLANYGAVLYPDLHDVFYNERFLNMAKSYWNAEYAKPESCCSTSTAPAPTATRGIWIRRASAACATRTHPPGCAA